jgi:peptide/nickel transport system substrate-binding protein
MQRRGFLATAAATVAVPLAAPSVQAQPAKVIKFAPQADLALVDPHFAPALVTRNHGYLVYDTLYGVDDAGQPHPQMAAGHVVEDNGLTWKITLRDGLRFHDNTPVLARDVVASLKRWATRDVFAISVWTQVAEISAPSDKVVQFRLKRPFRLLADLLGKPTPLAPAIMPERLASTSPSQQVSEVIGSGPYRYVIGERVPGSRNVYEKFAGYVPRQEPAVGTTGGKVVHVERVEWHTIPDPATAAAALQAGEIDWWEQPTGDLLPTLRRRQGVTVDIIDTLGYHAVMRFNHLHAPFNNPAVRRALLGAFSQDDMMTAVAGEDRKMWFNGVGFFHPNSPLANKAGLDALMSPRNLDQVKKNLAAAGYGGEKFSMLVPTDLPAINAMSEVAGDIFRKLGMNLDYVTLDWGATAQRLNSKAPPGQGGWNLNCNYAPGFATMSPAAHGFLRGTGQNALFGWPDMPKVEAARTAWIESTDAAEQKRMCEQLQVEAFDAVPYIPLGGFYFASAFRSNLSGLIKGGIPLFYNVKKA